MSGAADQRSSRIIIGGTFLASLLPFLIVEIFRSQFYGVMGAASYLVFHNLAIFFSVMVSLSIFGAGWFTFGQSNDRHALFLSAAFLAIGLVEFMHALSYPGMPAFITPNSANKAMQLRTVVQFTTAAAFLISALVYPDRRRAWLSKPVLISAALGVPLLVLGGITLVPSFLPATYVEGEGLTSFKKTTEFVIIAMLILAAVAYRRRIARTGEKTLVPFVAAFVIIVFSALSFAIYRHGGDTFNVLGHAYEIAAFFLIYRQIFIASVKAPYAKLDEARSALEADIEQRKRGEEVMKEQAALLNLAHDAIIVCDLQYRILFWNRGAEETYGWSAKDTVGCEAPEILHTKFPMAKEAIYTSVRSHGEWQGELTHTRRDGRRIVVASRWSLERDERGEPQAILEIDRDITARKLAEEAFRIASAYNRSLIEASLDPLVTISATGTITDVNAATEKITGRARHELIGTDFSDYFTEPARARAGYQQVFRDGFAHDYALDLRHKDGHTTPVVYNASVYKDEGGNVIGVFAAARDITERKRAEEQLRHSGYSLAEAQRIAHLGNWELDLVSNVLSWSDEIYRMFEIDPKRFGASYEAFLNAIHPDDRDMVDHAYSESVRNKKPYDIVHRLLMNDGRLKYVNERCETYYAENGKPLRSVGTVHDITERKLAEDALKQTNERLETIFSNTHVMFAYLDTEFNFIRVNRAYAEADERVPEFFPGKNHFALYPNAENEKIFRSVLKRGEPYTAFAKPFTYAEHPERGTSYWDWTLQPITGPTGTVDSLLLGLVNVSERVHAEEEIRILNAELEVRVAQRTVQLEAANKELEAFAYSVSHDLRAPLRSIDGFSLALLEDYAAIIDEQGKGYLHRVRAAAQHMADLIDDMLSLSRVTRTEMHIQPVDLSAMAEEIARDLKALDTQRQVTFEIPQGIIATGDARLLQIALENLLGNAWKFSANHESARVEFGTTQHEGKTAYFVRDDGAGFDQTYADKLFGAFHRLHSSAEFPGTGIGLATVQRIIHRHGGSTWAVGAVEQGATFYFTLG